MGYIFRFFDLGQEEVELTNEDKERLEDFVINELDLELQMTKMKEK